MNLRNQNFDRTVSQDSYAEARLRPGLDDLDVSVLPRRLSHQTKVHDLKLFGPSIGRSDQPAGQHVDDEFERQFGYPVVPLTPPFLDPIGADENTSPPAFPRWSDQPLAPPRHQGSGGIGHEHRSAAVAATGIGTSECPFLRAGIIRARFGSSILLQVFTVVGWLSAGFTFCLLVREGWPNSAVRLATLDHGKGAGRHSAPTNEHPEGCCTNHRSAYRPHL